MLSINSTILILQYFARVLFLKGMLWPSIILITYLRGKVEIRDQIQRQCHHQPKNRKKYKLGEKISCFDKSLINRDLVNAHNVGRGPYTRGKIRGSFLNKTDSSCISKKCLPVLFWVVYVAVISTSGQVLVVS